MLHFLTSSLSWYVPFIYTNNVFYLSRSFNVTFLLCVPYSRKKNIPRWSRFKTLARIFQWKWLLNPLANSWKVFAGSPTSSLVTNLPSPDANREIFQTSFFDVFTRLFLMLSCASIKIRYLDFKSWINFFKGSYLLSDRHTADLVSFSSPVTVCRNNLNMVVSLNITNLAVLSFFWKRFSALLQPTLWKELQA